MYHPELSSADEDEGKHDVAPISVVSAADAYHRESEVDPAVLVPDAEASRRVLAALVLVCLDLSSTWKMMAVVASTLMLMRTTRLRLCFQRWHAVLPNSRDWSLDARRPENVDYAIATSLRVHWCGFIVS